MSPEEDEAAVQAGLLSPSRIGQGKQATPKSTAYSATKPGDLLAVLIFKATGKRPCSTCDKRRRMMNQWGWWGCWRRRKEICQWLQEEAVARGKPIQEATVFALFREALREVMAGKNSLAKPKQVGNLPSMKKEP